MNEDVYISAIDCGVVNAFYDPIKSEIIMCNELIIDLFNFFSYAQDSATRTVLTYIAIFGHELGYALIDNLNLPILGKEEDAADAFSVVFLIETSNPEYRYYLAIGLVLMGVYLLQTPTPFYDEHSIGPSRLANIICWTAGAEPSILNDPVINAVYEKMVSAGRDCESEYKQQYNAVVKLLKPYLKNNL